MIAQEEADYIYDDMNDSDIVVDAGVEDEYADIEAQIDELDSDAEDYDAKLAELEGRMEKIVDDARENLKDSKSDEIELALDDPVQYFVHEQGTYRIEDLFKAPFIRINTEEAAEDAVATDGVAHFLSTYDGNEVELPSGAVAYRTN